MKYLIMLIAIFVSITVFTILAFSCEILNVNHSFENGLDGWYFDDAACCSRGGLYTFRL